MKKERVTYYVPGGFTFKLTDAPEKGEHRPEHEPFVIPAADDEQAIRFFEEWKKSILKERNRFGKKPILLKEVIRTTTIA